MSEYDRLKHRLLEMIDIPVAYDEQGNLIPNVVSVNLFRPLTLHKYDAEATTLDEEEQRLLVEVCDRTKMTPDLWMRLKEDQRIPWIKKTIDCVEERSGVERTQAERADLEARAEEALQQAALEQVERINRYHRLAARAGTVLLQLGHFRHCFNGDQHARPALLELERVVAEAPELPLADDPFCGEHSVSLNGVSGTSTHTALLALAARAWRVSQVTSLVPEESSSHTDPQGNWYTRVTQAVTRRSPTEVEWSVEVWQGIGTRLGRLVDLDADVIQAALAVERTRAARRLEGAVGVPFSGVVLSAPAGRLSNDLSAGGARPTPEVVRDVEATHGPAADEAAHEPATDEAPQYVTLDQAAAVVNRKKKTLLRALNKTRSTMPRPAVEGGGGKPHEWLWHELRPWLEQEYGKPLPKRFPSLRR